MAGLTMLEILAASVPTPAANRNTLYFEAATGLLSYKDDTGTVVGVIQTITLTGDVTGSGTGSFAATIANDAVTNAKAANMATATVKYRRTAGTGDPEDTALATLKTDLGLSGTNTGDQTITLTGDVTGTGTGSFAATIKNSVSLVTPVLNVATATSINKVALTAPATSATLTVADGKTLTASNSITLAGTDATTMTFPPASASVGYLNVPQNSQSAAYTTVLADAGKHIFHPSADTTARTWTIDSNANVAYPIGTAISFVNQNAGGVITIAITADTMRLAGAGTTGNRTLAANGVATALKVTSTEWIISGTGLT